MRGKVIDIQKRRKLDAKEAPGVADKHTVATLYEPEVQDALKEHIRRIWDLKRDTQGLTQAGLALALGLNQPAISRLLNNPEGHPWTVTHLMALGSFLGLTVNQLLPETHREKLRHFFRAWSNDEEDERALLRDCLRVVDKHFSEGGVRLERPERAQLGARLCERLQGGKVDDPTLEVTLHRLILEEAQAMARHRSKIRQ